MIAAAEGNQSYRMQKSRSILFSCRTSGQQHGEPGSTQSFVRSRNRIDLNGNLSETEKQFISTFQSDNIISTPANFCDVALAMMFSDNDLIFSSLLLDVMQTKNSSNHHIVLIVYIPSPDLCIKQRSVDYILHAWI